MQEKDQSANKKNNNNYNTTINYPLLNLNAVIIGSIFIFFALALFTTQKQNLVGVFLTVNYTLLLVNASVIGAIFIFFSIASRSSISSSVFSMAEKKCSFGFSLNPQESQIAVVITSENSSCALFNVIGLGSNP